MDEQEIVVGLQKAKEILNNLYGSQTLYFDGDEVSEIFPNEKEIHFNGDVVTIKSKDMITNNFQIGDFSYENIVI